MIHLFVRISTMDASSSESHRGGPQRLFPNVLDKYPHMELQFEGAEMAGKLAPKLNSVIGSTFLISKLPLIFIKKTVLGLSPVRQTEVRQK